MKKSISLFFFGILFSAVSLQAQSNEIHADVEKFGDLMCDCINTLMDDMHPEIKRMVRNMETLGEEEAQKRFKISARGKVMMAQAGKRHGMIKRTNSQIRKLRGTTAMSKQDGKIVKSYMPYSLRG